MKIQNPFKRSIRKYFIALHLSGPSPLPSSYQSPLPLPPLHPHQAASHRFQHWKYFPFPPLKIFRIPRVWRLSPPVGSRHCQAARRSGGLEEETVGQRQREKTGETEQQQEERQGERRRRRRRRRREGQQPGRSGGCQVVGQLSQLELRVSCLDLRHEVLPCWILTVSRGGTILLLKNTNSVVVGGTLVLIF